MKKVRQLAKGQPGLLGIVCLIAVLLTSCLKDNNDDVTLPPAALVSVINASPGAQPVDFYLDQNKANTYSIAYGQDIDYIRAYTGKRTATFYAAGTQQKIKADTTTLQADKFYTLYLTNIPSNPEFVLLRDSITRPAAGMAAIRFVNVSPDAPAVDLAIKQGNVLAANKGYKGYSPFISVQGNNTYTLEIRQAGTATVLVTLADVKITSSSVYTVWLQGLSAATDATKLSAHIQTNAYYY